MFNMSGTLRNQFEKIFENHRMITAQCNVFFYHIKLIAHRPTLLKDRNDFYEHFNLFGDIDLVTAPMDTFVEIPDNTPEEEESTEEKSFEAILNEMPHIVEINRLCPEFVKIQNRITKEEIIKNFPEDHLVIKALELNEDRCIDDLAQDCFIHWSVDQYLKNIDKLRLSLISNATPLIEWTVQNISLKDLKNYLTSTKHINEEKFREKAEDLFFFPDYNYTVKFYNDEKNVSSSGFEPFNIDTLMKKMISNEVVKSDIYIIIAIYTILTYCKVPIGSNTDTDEKCVNYVKEVISQL